MTDIIPKDISVTLRLNPLGQYNSTFCLYIIYKIGKENNRYRYSWHSMHNKFWHLYTFNYLCSKLPNCSIFFDFFPDNYIFLFSFLFKKKSFFFMFRSLWSNTFWIFILLDIQIAIMNSLLKIFRNLTTFQYLG